jgi:F-type H+-transporting ATPase subunit b
MVQKAGTIVTESEAHAKVFPPLDPDTFAPQLVWLAISFGLLYVLASRVVLPLVGKVIKERSDQITGDLAQAERLKAETEQALMSYEQALAKARTEANAIAKAIHDKVAVEIDGERARGEAEIAAKLADAERRIGEAKAKALANVDDIVSDVAGAIVTRLIGTEVSKEEVQKALTRQAAE